MHRIRFDRSKTAMWIPGWIPSLDLIALHCIFHQTARHCVEEKISIALSSLHSHLRFRYGELFELRSFISSIHVTTTPMETCCSPIVGGCGDCDSSLAKATSSPSQFLQFPFEALSSIGRVSSIDETCEFDGSNIDSTGWRKDCSKVESLQRRGFHFSRCMRNFVIESLDQVTRLMTPFKLESIIQVQPIDSISVFPLAMKSLTKYDYIIDGFQWLGCSSDV